MTHTLTELLRRLSRVLQNEGHAGGLNPVQQDALRYLARANRFSRTPSAVAAYLGSTKGTVSQTVRALTQKGLVEKQSDPENGRIVRLSLTASGKSMLDADQLSAIGACVDSLPAPQRRAAEGALETLLSQVLAARGGRPFGVCRTCRHFREGDGDRVSATCGLLSVPLSTEDSGMICAEHAPA